MEFRRPVQFIYFCTLMLLNSGLFDLWKIAGCVVDFAIINYWSVLPTLDCICKISQLQKTRG